MDFVAMMRAALIKPIDGSPLPEASALPEEKQDQNQEEYKDRDPWQEPWREMTEEEEIIARVSGYLDEKRHPYPSWRPWLAVVNHGAQLLHCEKPTLHTWADLQRWSADEDIRLVLEGDAWSRCSTVAWDAAEDARLLAELRARREAADAEVPDLPRPAWSPDAWDLRARAEGRLRRLAEQAAWRRDQRAVRRAFSASHGAEWQGDVRCRSTGDPNDPTYREFTHREIWDVITQRGMAADPRDVVVEVENPDATPDMEALGAAWRPSALEWLAEQGMVAGGPESNGDGPSLEEAEEW